MPAAISRRTVWTAPSPTGVELRAYCYAAAGDLSTLDLTRAVIMEQGIADPAFITLLDGDGERQAHGPRYVAFFLIRFTS